MKILVTELTFEEEEKLEQVCDWSMRKWESDAVSLHLIVSSDLDIRFIWGTPEENNFYHYDQPWNRICPREAAGEFSRAYGNDENSHLDVFVSQIAAVEELSDARLFPIHPRLLDRASFGSKWTAMFAVDEESCW